MENQQSQGKNMALASLICGIACLILPYIDTPLAIVAIVLGVLAKKKLAETNSPAGMAIAGIILGAVGLAWGIACIIMCVACGGIAMIDAFANM